jgi:hypothetical protein
VLLDVEPDRAVEQLETIGCSVVDSSSLILMHTAGFLTYVEELMAVETVRGVIREVGPLEPDVTVVPAPDETLTVDEQVAEIARRDNCPVITEDREILERADEWDVVACNALVMLEYVLLRQRITLVEWDACRKRLLACANYHPRVVHAGQELHWAVRKRIG